MIPFIWKITTKTSITRTTSHTKEETSTLAAAISFIVLIRWSNSMFTRSQSVSNAVFIISKLITTPIMTRLAKAKSQCPKYKLIPEVKIPIISCKIRLNSLKNATRIPLRA